MKHSVQFDRNRYFPIFLLLDAGIEHLTLLIKVAVAFTKTKTHTKQQTLNIRYNLEITKFNHEKFAMPLQRSKVKRLLFTTSLMVVAL